MFCICCYKMFIMKTQKDIVKTWIKIELNSYYGFPPIPLIPMEYDEKWKQFLTKYGY